MNTTVSKSIPSTNEDELLHRLLAGRLHEPRLVLGLHRLDETTYRYRANLPHAVSAELTQTGEDLQRIGRTSVFERIGAVPEPRHPVRLRWRDGQARVHESFDPYTFALQLPDSELQAFASGSSCRAYTLLGSHAKAVDGISGTLFAVWAPNAERVSVIGNFNHWDGRCHPMTVRGGYGVWELFIPELGEGELDKFEIRKRSTGAVHVKTDPFGKAFELRPATAAVTQAPSKFVWTDDSWLAERGTKNWVQEPISVYEVHLGSWRKGSSGEFLSYKEIAERLCSHVERLGFTHVELLPITEHPFDDSWGYQTTGLFAPTSRFGSADELRYLISALHDHGIGVILDWVPGHFPKDDHALARFDGTSLYEYGDPRRAEHPDWQTLVFDYSRNEVRSFLLSSAIYWLEEFHVDGLRVDAVASMLYLDYSRTDGQWEPNRFGGNENLEAIAFLQQLNHVTHGECPGTITIAEESTAWPMVSRPTYAGGLGFTFKWNMGWMHDTLAYMKKDPVHRRFHHDLLTFGPIYAFTENFVLPLSHDEVVHGKGSLLGRMPGDDWQRFANLRLMFTFQWTYPGKKLLFMGGEMAQRSEWNHRESLPWHLLDEHWHACVSTLLTDLNSLYRYRLALQRDSDADGFYWLSWQDADNSVLSYVRQSSGDHIVVALNFTPVPRHQYRIGVPTEGRYREILNSDSRFYGGTDIGNASPIETEKIGHMDQPYSIVLSLPSLGGVVLAPE
jgi:1,4-alpha-glucan branching enzyme